MASSIYLAGRYSRREELLGIAAILQRSGHTVTARWLQGEHEAIDGTADRMTRAQWAIDDLADVQKSDELMLFTDEVGGSGGKDFELCYAMMLGKRVSVIGPLTHVFTCLPGVQHYTSWGDFIAANTISVPMAANVTSFAEAVRRRAQQELRHDQF